MNSALLKAISAIAVAASALVTCGQTRQVQKTESAAPTVKERTLSSGKTLKVTDIRQRELDDLGSTLILEYQTDLKIDLAVEHHKALQREVEEIWVDFRADAESRGVQTVFIVPEDASTHESLSFVLRRAKDGRWLKSGGFAYPSSKEKLGERSKR